METAGAAKAKKLPHSATIVVHDGVPKPEGQVEVEPGGTIHFRNKDKKGYRVRYIRKDSESSPGISILLPPKGIVTVLIMKEDEFMYTVFPLSGTIFNGHGGGPIRN